MWLYSELRDCDPHRPTVFATVKLTDDELEWLKTKCPYLTPEYLAYLASFRFKPEQVTINYIPVSEDNLQGRVEIDIAGPWRETILWEVPLMAALSETFFQVVMKDWSYEGQPGEFPAARNPSRP